MTHQPNYNSMARQVFSQYLDNQIDLATLMERLRYMELQLMAAEEDEGDEQVVETGKKVWFRFFAGDDLKTIISDIEKDLSDPSHPNARILLQGIAFGLEKNELEVHYS